MVRRGEPAAVGAQRSCRHLYEPDHISAYSLIVEDGTKLAAQIRRGEYTMPDEDLMADMYLLAEELPQKPATTGTRSPTTHAARTPAATTTSPTGVTRTGGVSARAPTRT